MMGEGENNDYWLSHWIRYYKKIPQRGLNNLTREKHYEYQGNKL